MMFLTRVMNVTCLLDTGHVSRALTRVLGPQTRDRVSHLHLQFVLDDLLVVIQHLPVDHHHGVHIAGGVRGQHLPMINIKQWPQCVCFHSFNIPRSVYKQSGGEQLILTIC